MCREIPLLMICVNYRELGEPSLRTNFIPAAASATTYELRMQLIFKVSDEPCYVRAGEGASRPDKAPIAADPIAVSIVGIDSSPLYEPVAIIMSTPITMLTTVI